MREKLKEALKAALTSVGLSGVTDIPIAQSADVKNGDYSSSVALQYAKQLKRTPIELATHLAASMGQIKGVRKIEIAQPGYINFHLTYETFQQITSEARTNDMWGANDNLAGKKIMVEYTDPNPFKEFHIGHLMSNAIGESIARLFQFSGAEVKRANYQGDVGPHVAKAIWGMIRLGTDAHDAKQIGTAYASGAQAYESDAGAKVEIDSINAKVYDGSDTEINELYAAGRQTSLDHFEEIYKILGTKFDYYFFESATAPKGIEIVKAHPNVFVESDRAIVYKGEQDGLHTRVFITSKGLPTYETKELGLAEMKAETWNCDVSVTITAHEQSDYFAVVLAAMKRVMPEIAQKIQHISHGMMRFAEGKMSSRTGNVITGESLLTDLIEAAKERAAESRADDHVQLAQDVAVAAIKYQILRQQSSKDIIFDRERALSLEGDSGPYLQYAYARAVSLLEKAQDARKVPQMKADADEDFQEVGGMYLLSRKISAFPDIIARAAEETEPHHVATYLIELAAVFSRWYGTERIIVNGETLADRPALIEAVSRTLKNGLWILGIPTPEKM